MIDLLTEHVRAGADLDATQVAAACEALLDEEVPVEVRAAFLDALHRKGETPGEIAAFVTTLLGHAVPFPLAGTGCIDVCGTGGDKAGFFNVSTASMFVAAACGARVVKHGNRGITSKAGGADVLEALGVRVDLPPDRAAAALESSGCCFLFAPAYHPAFKAVAPVRKWMAEQGRTSVFNMLGPLLNPARPDFQLAGVFDPSLLETYASVFQRLGRRRAWAVHGSTPDGGRLDEISPLGPTRVVALDGGSIASFEIDATPWLDAPIDPQELAGSDVACNATILLDLLGGGGSAGAKAITQLNAGAALVVAGLATDLAEGFAKAGEALSCGAARSVLERLRAAA